jgi:hypothetical protein
MAQIGVNKAQWEALSPKQQVHVRAVLVKAKVLQEDDVILADPGAPPLELGRDDFPPYPDLPDGCVDACALAAEMAYANCVAMGGNPTMCGLAAEAIWRQCCEACAQGLD